MILQDFKDIVAGKLGSVKALNYHQPEPGEYIDYFYNNGKMDAFDAVLTYIRVRKEIPDLETMAQGIAYWEHKISSGGPLAYSQGNLDAYREVESIIKAEGIQ